MEGSLRKIWERYSLNLPFSITTAAILLVFFGGALLKFDFLFASTGKSVPSDKILSVNKTLFLVKTIPIFNKAFFPPNAETIFSNSSCVGFLSGWLFLEKMTKYNEKVLTFSFKDGIFVFRGG